MTEYERLGIEGRQLAQRAALRAAMIAAKGDVRRAGQALGLDRRKVATRAREVGLDWEALCAEARGE